MLKFDNPLSDVFAFDSERNILDDKDLGIKNYNITTGTPHSNVLCLDGLWAPPYVSSNFKFLIRIDGETVKSSRFTWYPFAIERYGKINGIEIESLCTFKNRSRSLVIKIVMKNKRSEVCKVPVQIDICGGIDYVHLWEFAAAVGTKQTDLYVEPNKLKKVNNDKALIISSSMQDLQWHDYSQMWECREEFKPYEEKTIYFAVALDSYDNADCEICEIMADPEKIIADMVKSYEDETADLFSRIPKLASDNKQLVRFYNRSLVHYLTNKWKVEDFVIDPYYSTGGIKGGCVGSYLWDFSAGWQINAVYDPETTKNQIRRYLLIDISRCYAFNPVDGSAFGPWYPVNHEKIIGLIYYYVKNTGDFGFLKEIIGTKSVAEWAVYHSLIKDNTDKDVMLTDYGIDGEHHLELRRGFPYRGVLPDLNARRYMSYVKAYEITEMSGEPNKLLLQRADRLKQLVKKELWNKEARWFDFINAGKREIRYTIQMFKLFSGGILDEEEEAGLLSHLNESEFLSEYGIHSMSKTDPAYDQVDIDNGGGGACSIFAPIIAGKLYNAGKGEYADNILKRILWWGERLPYWGDSLVANYIDYRHDTPLQCTVGGVAGAECIIFGMLGIQCSSGGEITVDPHCPSFCKYIKAEGLKIRDKVIDVTVYENEFTVICDHREYKSMTGMPVLITNDYTPYTDA